MPRSPIPYTAIRILRQREHYISDVDYEEIDYENINPNLVFLRLAAKLFFKPDTAYSNKEFKFNDGGLE